MRIYLHSDDFGLTNAQAEALTLLAAEGTVNSVSVLANDERLPEHVLALLNAAPETRIAVHINFVEGSALLEHDMLPDLTDERGFFSLSYGKLLIKSLLPGRRRLLGQLIAEARAQIVAAMYCRLPAAPLSIDTHQHTHAIPIVAKAIAVAIAESGANVAAVRIPRERLAPYLKHPKTLIKIPPVNFIKRAVLNLLLLRSAREFRAYPSPEFMGVLMTANVDERGALAVLPDFIKLAKRRGKDLEILFHPARVADIADCPDPENAGFCAFNLSPRRDEEKAILRAFAKEIGKLRREGAV